MRGEIETYAIHPDGTRELIERGNNLVVNSAYIAIAMAMAYGRGHGGFMYWALGTGDGSDTSSWDAGVGDGSIAAEATDTALANEVYRKHLDISSPDVSIDFIDTQNNVSATPTNRLQISVTFNETEPYSDQSAFLREWGIFGGDASGTLGSGYLINRKTHVTYEKTQFSKLERVLRFTF